MQYASALLIIGFYCEASSHATVNNGIVRAVIQRVKEAQVTTRGTVIARIGTGLCVFLGVGKEDNQSDADLLAAKIQKLRIFEDDQGKLNLSVADIRGELLVVSQFTLYGNCKKGNRPSFTDAAVPALAERLYEHVVQRLRQSGLVVGTGRFQTHMDVALTNDGPVTLILES